MGLPVQAPLPALSDWPLTVDPVIVGGELFVGGAGGGATTSGLAAEVADALPLALLAPTATRSVWPTSPEPRLYVLWVAPLTFAQPSPVLPQRSHW